MRASTQRATVQKMMRAKMSHAATSVPPMHNDKFQMQCAKIDGSGARVVTRVTE